MSQNSELLESFAEYCRKNPGQRFWQALTNWSGLPYVGYARNPSGDGFCDLWHYKGKVSPPAKGISHCPEEE